MRKLRWLAPVMAVLVLTAGDCFGGGDEAAQPRAPRATPAGTFAHGVDSATGAEVAAYAGSLQFDTSAIASDAQYLYTHLNASPLRGPYGRIAPEIGVNALAEADAERGRIIGRIGVQPGNAPVEPIAYLYIWADKRGGSWRTMLLSDSGVVDGPMSMQVHNHGSLGGVKARAVWIVASGEITIPTWCISCSDRIGWCGRPQPFMSDPRTWAYLRQKLGGGMWPGFPAL